MPPASSRHRPRYWFAPILISIALNLALFAVLAHWIVVKVSPTEHHPTQAAATPERLDETPQPEDPFTEPAALREPDNDPPLPTMVSEPWLTAPLALDDAIHVEPEAVPPGLFDFPDGPAAPGPLRRHGRRTGVGTTIATSLPIPEVTVQEEKPTTEPEPGALPDHLLAGLKKSGHLAVPSVKLRLRGSLAKQIREQIMERRIYPEDAVDLGLEGQAMTLFRLDARGRVHDLKILNLDDVDPILAEGARRSIQAGAPYPVPDITVNASLYMAVACWTDGKGTVKRVRMVEGTGRDALDTRARNQARAVCARSDLGWHVVEFEHEFKVRVHAVGDNFVPSLMASSLPKVWVDVVRAELADLIPAITTTATIRIPITFRLKW